LKNISAQYVPLQYIPKFWYMEMQVFNSEGDSATLVLVSEKDINLHGVFSCSLRTTVTSSFKYVQFSWKVAMLCKIFTGPVSVEVKHFLIMQYFLYQHVLVLVIGFKLFPWYVLYMYLPYVQCAFAAGTDTQLSNCCSGCLLTGGRHTWHESSLHLEQCPLISNGQSLYSTFHWASFL
jgi:hypothetical protein